MRKTLLTLALVALALPTHADEAQMIENARQTAMQLIKQLGGELQKQLASGGPESAISVCREKAPAIASEMSRSTGWRVTRVSLKTRNPLLGTPDEWEQGALKILERRLAEGAKPETLEFAQVVEEPAGKVFRYLKALPVQPVCTTCHGKPEDIGDGVKARLAAEYPHDKATGYSPGMIRGGISIKRPL
ncbi:MAG: Tll0287-like domain-containing protein [Thiobacillaceae bacterium]